MTRTLIQSTIAIAALALAAFVWMKIFHQRTEEFPLKSSFAEHFHGNSTEAMAAFREELRANEIPVWPNAQLELNIGKTILRATYLKKAPNTHILFPVLEYMAVSGWWHDPVPGHQDYIEKQVRESGVQMREEVEKQRQRVDAAKLEFLKVRDAWNIVDPNPDDYGMVITHIDYADPPEEKKAAFMKSRIEEKQHQNDYWEAKTLYLQSKRILEAAHEKLRQVEWEDRFTPPGWDQPPGWF